jgi:Fe-S-cluster-containing dehydrogenase component/DMSO reductase anchor subunit
MRKLPVIDPTAENGEAVCHAVVPTGPALVRALHDLQQAPPAVEAFDRWHRSVDAARSPTSAPRYSAVLPATPPRPGQQYAFEVDLDRCSGCKACVTACHTLNGLDEFETWRDVGLLIGGAPGAAVVQHVTTACHHCLEPACATACPVNAYAKDPDTGVVKHLDDQCFGCQYCILACPYDVPKYHPQKGIVRKCDMCSQRLAVGQPPACVWACPQEAISIHLVDHDRVRADAETAVFLPAAPDPQHTYPTTTYRTRRSFPRNLLPADYFSVNPQHAHWPLVVMLVLTQMSVGAFVIGVSNVRLLGGQFGVALQSLHACSSLSFGVLALGASVFHLGRPRYAFRAVLGLKHSWLSREIVAFVAFALLAFTYALALLLAPSGSRRAAPSSLAHVGAVFAGTWMATAVAWTGVSAIFCSVMIYVATRRECWSFARTATRFGLSAAVLGLTTAWFSVLVATLVTPSAALFEVVQRKGPVLCRVVIALAAAKLAWEAAIFRHLLAARMTPLRRCALLQSGELSNVTLARFALGILGGLIMPSLLLGALPSLSPESLVSFAAMTVLLLLANLAGELLERYLFFAACAAPRMPGGIR